ncbi:MAG: GGDEF domain-containing protein [Dokdonella sp.]|uniref:GGDEF domain-containing protein n=1 Tax=Dokdonella sp. TaxID=2291710 RepID=UPI003BB0660C
MTADAIDEVQRRLERRLKTRVFDTYARSSVGGFLYLVAWIPLVYFTGMHARNPLVAVLASAGFMYAAILRKLARPPSHAAEAQRRWINRYIAIALSSAVIWSMMQFWTLSSGDVPTLIKAASLFGTIAFSTVLAHLYTTLLRLSVLGIAILVVPSAVALWVDPALHVLAMATTLYAGYLVAATIRSHADYRRRLDLDAALRDQRDRYEHLSRTDSLTGLCNRRTFSETLNAQVREAQWLSGAGVALALLDIDHFKAINDRHGHVIGDEVLRQLARRLESAFSGDDVMVARTGGEEFGLILRDADEVEAMIRVEAFREALQAEPVVCAGISIPVTVSVGVGRFSIVDHRDDDGLYGAVDAAMYAAKQRGRNRVVSVSMLSSSLPVRVRAEGLEAG